MWISLRDDIITFKSLEARLKKGFLPLYGATIDSFHILSPFTKIIHTTHHNLGIHFHTRWDKKILSGIKL